MRMTSAPAMSRPRRAMLWPMRILAKLALAVPTGYQDATGFHFGVAQEATQAGARRFADWASCPAAVRDPEYRPPALGGSARAL